MIFKTVCINTKIKFLLYYSTKYIYMFHIMECYKKKNVCNNIQ